MSEQRSRRLTIGIDTNAAMTQPGGESGRGILLAQWALASAGRAENAWRASSTSVTTERKAVA